MAQSDLRNSLYRINGRWNPLADDRYFVDDIGSPISDEYYDEPIFESPLSTPYDANVRQNLVVHANDLQSPFTKSRLQINFSGDEADVPLLTGNEGFGTVIYEGSNLCREPMPTSNSNAWKKLVAATAMCLFFMVVELVGGYIAGSLAVMTDAAHLLSDCVGFLVGLFAVWVVGQPPTKKFTYGYHRAEVLGALLSISVVWILAGVFVYLAIDRLIHLKFQIHADAMLIVSAIGIGINIIMGFILHGGLHSHGQKSEHNINVKAAIIHVLGDLIQSMGVFISACVIKFYPEAKVVDPICTFICCLLVIGSTLTVLRDSIWVLLETAPSNIDSTQLLAALQALEGVDSVHALHVWALTPGQYVLTAHLCVNALTDRDLILEKAQRMLRNKFGLERITLQVERHMAQILAQ